MRGTTRFGLRLLAAIDIAVAVGAIAAALWWTSTSSAAPTFTLHKVENAAFTPQPMGAPFFVLVIGNDGRAGLEGTRGDGIHLVGINPAANTATILNIPRDTWVSVPGFGMDKINGAYLAAGLQKQVETVAGLTGVSFSFVIETNFDGFQALVDEMGGIHVDVPYRVFDKASGADFQPGRTHMLGPGALSYARNRHIPGGDIARTTNQGWLLIAGLERAREVAQSPFGTMRLLGLMARHTHYEGVGLHELYQLTNLGLGIDPANVRNVTMPARVGMAGPASVVFAAPGAQELFADFRDDAVLQNH